MSYSLQERKAIAAALRAAKPLLWDGGSAKAGPGRKSAFICNALEFSGHPASAQAQAMILSRLGGKDSINTWLWQCAGVPLEQLTPERVQPYRHQWLDRLIAEFSQYGRSGRN